jgi:hypothetical protein
MAAFGARFTQFSSVLSYKLQACRLARMAAGWLDPPVT